MPAFDITADLINHVVARFYAQVRDDFALGPIFVPHVTNWPDHEDRIARFWRNAILQEDCYSGNPLKAHKQAGNITVADFAPWLSLFDTVLAEELTPEQARAWSALSHRLGGRLTGGMQGDVPPHLQD